MFRAFFLAAIILLGAGPSKAQEAFWVQIAARPTLSEATAFARDAGASLSGVYGFYLGNGFYGIAVGPFERAEAERVRSRLLGSGAIPGDSFVTNGAQFEQQFWPIGGNATSGSVPTIPITDAPSADLITALPDETPREARASEAALSQAERERLQEALQWAGFYDAAIDGLFGRGTRTAMERWQIANAAEPTGILTSRQREQLIADFNAVLVDLGLQTVTETNAGIAMQIPLAIVSFTQYSPPFVKFETATGDVAPRVLMISQPGDEEILRGLYEIMQSLAIVPFEGERTLRGDRFIIEGIDEDILSFTEVALRDGQIKGFTLVWPANDKARRDRLLTEMRTSFVPLQGVLDPQIVPLSEDQSIDMVAGLALRQPRLARSGFFVSENADVLTTAEAVASCERITIDQDAAMTVIAQDQVRGLALLTPVVAQTPRAFARFDQSVPRLQDRVAVAGYPYGGILSAPTLSFGQIADLRSLTGDDTQKRLSIFVQPSDAGGPVLDLDTGAVMGLLLPAQTGAQQLPQDVNFARKASDIAAFLQQNGLAVRASDTESSLSRVALTELATDMGVLVNCW